MAPEQMAEPPEHGPAPPAGHRPATSPDSAPAPPPAGPLDTIGRGVLAMLRTDGRASVRSVAERVHISRANAYARVNRRLEDG